MGRSQWFTIDATLSRPWVADAKCGDHQELPWTGETAPGPFHYMKMAQICAECPVVAQCASYALTTAGGFYAGHWLPWHTAVASAAARVWRTRSRRELKRIANQQEAYA